MTQKNPIDAPPAMMSLKQPQHRRDIPHERLALLANTT
jgi:hypothetical protein